MKVSDRELGEACEKALIYGCEDTDSLIRNGRICLEYLVKYVKGPLGCEDVERLVSMARAELLKDVKVQFE